MFIFFRRAFVRILWAVFYMNSSSMTLRFMTLTESDSATFLSRPFRMCLTKQIRFYFNKFSCQHRLWNDLCFTLKVYYLPSMCVIINCVFLQKPLVTCTEYFA